MQQQQMQLTAAWHRHIATTGIMSCWCGR